MLLGGRAADLLGRRRVLVAGTVLLGVSSFIGGLAGTEGVLIGARLLQGVGAAMMLPAAILTTTFKEGKDRHTAIGVWGGVGGLASAAGVLLGGVLTEGPGWRWVMFVNPLAAVLVLCGIFQLISGERRRAPLRNFDLVGAILVTGGMLLLVYALVTASTIGWGNARTIGAIAAALALLVGFVINELRHRNPLAPLSIFRINGLGFSNITQLTAIAGFLAMFFFLTLYMQTVLHYSPTQTGLSYLPLCFTIGISAGSSSQLLSRVGTRAVIVAHRSRPGSSPAVRAAVCRDGLPSPTRTSTASGRSSMRFWPPRARGTSALCLSCSTPRSYSEPTPAPSRRACRGRCAGLKRSQTEHAPLPGWPGWHNRRSSMEPRDSSSPNRAVRSQSRVSL